MKLNKAYISLLLLLFSCFLLNSKQLLASGCTGYEDCIKLLDTGEKVFLSYHDENLMKIEKIKYYIKDVYLNRNSSPLLQKYPNSEIKIKFINGPRYVTTDWLIDSLLTKINQVKLLPNKSNREYNHCTIEKKTQPDLYSSLKTHNTRCDAKYTFKASLNNGICPVPLAFTFPTIQEDQKVFLCHKFFMPDLSNNPYQLSYIELQRFFFTRQVFIVLHELMRTLGIQDVDQITDLNVLVTQNCKVVKFASKDDNLDCSKY